MIAEDRGDAYQLKRRKTHGVLKRGGIGEKRKTQGRETPCPEETPKEQALVFVERRKYS